MVASIVAIAFFLSNHVELDTIAFTLAVILAGIFELFVISYFGTMSSKGYMAPVAAFCASSAIVRLGFSIGEVWAVLYEDIQGIWNTFVEPTSLFLMCLCSAVAYSLVRSEGHYSRNHGACHAERHRRDLRCGYREFKLSKREGEILKLVARGYTVDKYLNKLVISPYTTQTHIRHILREDEHSQAQRAVDYINMHRDSEKPVRPAARPRRSNREREKMAEAPCEVFCALRI